MPFRKWFGFGIDRNFDLGLTAYDRGFYQDALDHFRDCLETVREPSLKRLARFYRGECCSRLGREALKAERFDDAIGWFGEALECNPNYPDILLNLARAHKGMDHRDLHVEFVQKALAVNARYAAAILQLGLIQYEEGKFEEALATIERAAEIDPGLRNDRLEFVLESHRNGDTARAKANIEALTSEQSTDANAHAQVADSFARQGDWILAGQEYARALEIAPEYADVRCKFGIALLELNNVESAIDQFRHALLINPKYVEALAHLGIALRRLGKSDEAKEAFRAALELDPHHVIAAEEILRR